ncbi:MAG: hypothetical protein WC914_01050 [Proteiniphilum sp.]
MKQVIVAPVVEDYLVELIELLYNKDYFGFKEDAIEYVYSLISDIYDTLPNKVSKIAPPYFSRYGKDLCYSVFKKNDNTQWYVFFNYEDNIFYVRYVGNNHTCAQHIR